MDKPSSTDNFDLDLDFSQGTPQSLPEVIETPQAPKIQTHRFSFSGTAEEYFRIWIVNIFLSIVTLGIYYAWAKVRTRQYFYANTQLAGYNFEYLGNPRAILKGNLIVAGGFLLFYVVQNFVPFLSIGAGVLFFAVYPFLLYSSMRFLAANSAYRNIRFRFHGTLGQSYVNYMLLPALTPFTLGLLFPYATFRQRQYLFGNAALGKSRSHFKGESGSFYSIYLMAAGLAVGMFLIFGVVAVAIGVGAAFTLGDGLNDPAALLPVIVPLYGLLILGWLALQQFLSTRIANYCWNASKLEGNIGFISSLKARDMIKLRITNTLAIFFSLGLLIPWAKVRYTRYVLANLVLVSYGDLDDFVADKADSENAIGDAATDFFNIEIGL